MVYVKREAQGLAELPFEEIRLLPGDEVRLVYIRDIDGDADGSLSEQDRYTFPSSLRGENVHVRSTVR